MSKWFMVIISSNDKNEIEIKKKKCRRRKWFWIIKISLLAFLLSLLLRLFSEIILNKSNVVIAIILLIIFMLLNIFSDMLGLAITSCQIEILKQEQLEKRLYDRCIKLIKNSDKVSSLLCDVVGDICGILCGVSGTMISYIIMKHIFFSNVGFVLGALTSAVIAGLTVFFKAISKNYAVKNSTKIVKKTASFLLVLEKFKRRKNDKVC